MFVVCVVVVVVVVVVAVNVVLVCVVWLVVVVKFVDVCMYNVIANAIMIIIAARIIVDIFVLKPLLLYSYLRAS